MFWWKRKREGGRTECGPTRGSRPWAVVQMDGRALLVGLNDEVFGVAGQEFPAAQRRAMAEEIAMQASRALVELWVQGHMAGSRN